MEPTTSIVYPDDGESLITYHQPSDITFHLSATDCIRWRRRDRVSFPQPSHLNGTQNMQRRARVPTMDSAGA
jgi:hypothetical protein